MSDDFGTINISRADRSAEIEKTRQQYRRHRESLESMIADAPPEPLGSEYRRIVQEIDDAMRKLDVLDRRPVSDDTRPIIEDPGLRPLVTTTLPEAEVEPRSRLPLILLIAFVALAAIGWLMWRASSNRRAAGPIVEDTTATTATTATTTTSDATTTQAAAEEVLTVAPASNDYGSIRKGTRATRQYEVTNHGDTAVTITLSRSTCRCLFYEYQALIAPKGKESVTVTIDGARAKAGDLREKIRVTSKADPTVGTSFDVIATIQ